MKTRLILLSSALMLTAGLRAELRELAFHVVQPTPRPLAIDGRMSDPLWARAAAHTNYYVYFKASPGPSPLRTEFRMLYDARGVYLGIRNFDGNMAGIRRRITDHGNIDVWTDDCAELYFGGSGHGGGFRCFKSNALGATHEMNRLDTAVVVGEWRGTGWFVKTSIQDDHWIIEGFFPWEDIGRVHEPGEMLRFCHTRYAYSSGKFVGATSSPGGNYESTHNFGYGYLAREGQTIQPKQIAGILAASADPPWGLVIDNQLIADTGNGPRIEPLADAMGAAVARLTEIDRLVTEAAATVKHPKILEELETVRAATRALLDRPDRTIFAAFQALSLQAGQVEELWLGMKLEKEFN